MITPNTPSAPIRYERPDRNPGSTDDFDSHLHATRAPEPIPADVAASNTELGYQPSRTLSEPGQQAVVRRFLAG